MGTPDFAVESLRALVEGGYNVVRRDMLPANPIIVRRPPSHGGKWVKLPVQEGYLGRFLEKGP